MASNLRVDSIVPSTSANVSIGTATGGVTIPGDLGIAGVLTYEDVTNVDSVGVITARDGIRCTGIVTATAFHGDGSNLTSLPVPTTITVADESSDTTCNPLFVTTTSGNLAPKTGTNLVFNSATGRLGTGSLFLGTGSNESKAQDGLIMERNSGDGIVHMSAGRSGGNYSGFNFYVAGDTGGADSNIKLRHQMIHDGSFRWYDSDGTTERLRLTSNGKIGFNYAATPPSEDIMICTAGQASPAGVSISHLSGGNRYGLRLQSISGTNAGITFSPFINSSYNEGMRIQYVNATSSTKVGIGNVDPPYPLTVQYAGSNASNAAVSRFYQLTNNQGEDHTCFIVRHAAARPGQNGVALLFQNSGGTTVGKIDHGQSTTQYRTSSDYRLKENDVKITDGITRIKQLRPIKFNFIAEPDKTVDGFFAHEAAVAVPEAVSGTKDEVDSDNNPIIQGIDHSKLVPLLTAALQEAITKIETLEARVAALEGS